MNQKQLLMYITQISFALDDVALFLDTHPCDKEALEYYDKVKELRREALETYSCQYGPLQKDMNEDSCSWKWVKTPWPWE